MDISKIEVPTFTASGNGYIQLNEKEGVVGCEGKINLDIDLNVLRARNENIS